jgi:Ca-activated chloride channel family protein
MLDRSLRRLSWVFLLALPALAQPPSPQPDPILWPEPQRAFWQDGPALLLSEEQRTAFLALDEAGRERFIQELLDQDPLPETPANELREGIERRGRLVALEFASPQDVRSQLLFLKGRPVRRTVVDCAATFRPLEVWTYAEGGDAALRDLIVYQPSADVPFRLWLPIDSKAALYVEEMIYWLTDMEKVRLGGKRLDRFFCPDSELVDRVTGVEGLFGTPVATATVSVPRKLTEEPETRVYYWADPQNRAAMLARPRDLASWARAAALTPLPELPPLLTIGKLEMDFPRWQGQRLVARALLTLPLPFGMEVLDGQNGPRVRLTVDGVVEREGRIFEDFRLRYQLPPPGPDGPGVLLVERQLRPGQTFLLRLKVRDPATGAEGNVVRGFRVPDRTVQLLPAGLTSGASAGEAVQASPVRADTLLLIPPAEEVVLGTWRAETVVTGGRIAKVGFLVDGKLQVVRSRPPYSAEIRLATFPREQLVRVEGYDEDGALVAADQMLLNQARGGFRVRITEPRRGARATGEVLVRAEVVVPEERKVQAVEVRVNDTLVATLDSPPWQHRVEVPAGDEIAYLTVTALLDDGGRAEDVRFLRAPANLDEVEVNLVELFATVLDGDGHPVRGLAEADFQVFEAGKPQTLARFEHVDNLPLSLGIAIDTSFSMASYLDEAERAANSFLRGVMKPGDRCFALAITSRPELLIPPVDDVEAVSLALEGLRSFGRTAFHDAVITSLYHFRAQRGQRALILLTDGEDTGSATSWNDVLEYARRSGVAIYAIGLDVAALKRSPRAKLDELAEVSGGRAFFVEHAHELAGIYSQIEAELRSRYLLAYNSSQPADENGFRRIEVKARRGLKVRTGRGYVP